ncbi:MAG: redoxin domain-containing protein [Gemmatimonadetes bacterium]|nr:redoxin domain-containing protein [Gemmatimonadota bacterium]MXX71394.1 redoxin domain-containing protein [Gemmatimonadota bacterium]MYC92099.1 redoxin domain-containing protein [Gemmatimonadota bacterium]MYG34409.1 redoxin domain-containing protein [Gemmatimonadota bacterium]MYJ17028.1 redoxin domain-containing protein [Gemmatimonadota bacterium]
MRRSLASLLRLCALSLIAVGAFTAASARAQTLGPVDGHDLPPTDIERVALGDEAPLFTLDSFDRGPVDLAGFRGEKNVVLVFYRGHW